MVINFVMFHRQKKIPVEIVLNGVITKRKFPITEEGVILKAAQRGRHGGPSQIARVEKGCWLEETVGVWPFKRQRKKLMMRAGALQCMSFEAKQPDTNLGTTDDYARYFERGIMHKWGETVQALKIPTAFYVFFLILLGLVFIDLLADTGRLII